MPSEPIELSQPIADDQIVDFVEPAVEAETYHRFYIEARPLDLDLTPNELLALYRLVAHHTAGPAGVFGSIFAKLDAELRGSSFATEFPQFAALINQPLPAAVTSSLSYPCLSLPATVNRVSK